MYTLQFDGLFRKVAGKTFTGSKAGFMGYGWLISKNGVVIARGHGVYARGKDATSNIAEYMALIEGLESLADLGIRSEPVKIVGDAKCIIDQMNGLASVNSPSMKPLYRKARGLARKFHKVTWIWTPREENIQADNLTRLALAQVRADEYHYKAAVRAIHLARRGKGKSGNLLSLLDLRIYQPASQAGD